jgi:hypothetical protein
MKRCIGSYKETQCFNFIPVGILYKQKGIVEGVRLCGLIQKIKTQTKSKEELETFTRSEGGREDWSPLQVET